MSTPILRLRDKDGNIYDVLAIVGPRGPKGDPGVGMDNITLADVTDGNGKTLGVILDELWQSDASMADAVGAKVENTNGVVSGMLTITGNAGLLNLIGTDHIYVPFFKDGSAAGRSAYIGYGEAASKNFSIVNQLEGGLVWLDAPAGVAIPNGSLHVNGRRVPAVYQSTDAPTASDGKEGDVWHQYV